MLVLTCELCFGLCNLIKAHVLILCKDKKTISQRQHPVTEMWSSHGDVGTAVILISDHMICS